MKRILIITTLISTVLAHWVEAQSISKKELLESWEAMATMVISSAEAMDEKDYNYIPVKPLRNFANQINHTTSSNIGLGAMVFGKMPDFPLPDRANPPQTKKDVVALLKKSFEYITSNIAALSNEQLEQKIQWGNPQNPSTITRLKGLLIMHSHLQREHGKTMMYLREKGIAPPAAKSWVF